VPEPLPPAHLLLAPKTHRLIEETTHALAKVDACRSVLSNPELLHYASLRMEAIASSTIENTVASPDELALFEVTKKAGRAQVREVANYGVALIEGVRMLSTRPISVNLLLDVHEILMMGVRGEEHGGRLKTFQNYIAARRSDPIELATFVPPSPVDTPSMMSDLERYINVDPAEPRVVQVALAHYQFETIHPFADGNGRVGRLLIVLHLIQLGLLSSPLLYPSAYFERTRDQYYDELQRLRRDGEWERWIIYFVEGLRQQAHRTLELVDAIRAVLDSLRALVASVRRHASMARVLDAFMVSPVLTAVEASESAGLSMMTTYASIRSLGELGILSEITGRRRGRAYICKPLMETLFAQSASR
jgi:Fic family protein